MEQRQDLCLRGYKQSLVQEVIHHKGDGWWGIRKPGIQFRMPGFRFGRMLKNAHLRRCSHSSSLQRTSKYALLFRISSALHVGIFEPPSEKKLFQQPVGSLIVRTGRNEED